MKKVKVADWKGLADREPAHALVSKVDLVVIRWDDSVSVLFGRCQHRGALMADGLIRGDDIVCGVHNWDYGFKSGISSYNPKERLHKFNAWIEEGGVWADEEEIADWERQNPQAYDRDAYQGQYQDHHGTPVEPHVKFIRELAAHGLEKVG